MIPGTGALVLGRVYLSNYNSVYALSFTLSIYGTLMLLYQGIIQHILFIQLKADPLYSFALFDYREADYPEADPD